MIYAMERTTNGWRYNVPSGMHDDTVIATALSLCATRHYGRENIVEFRRHPAA